ncbi:unnamed protein product, partial [Ectocarpus sp. 12 AP-2014]
MGDIKDQMAAKVQAAARGYIQRKTGMGGKTAGKKHKGGKAGKGGKKAKKSKDMNAMIIQAAFKKYK